MSRMADGRPVAAKSPRPSTRGSDRAPGFRRRDLLVLALPPPGMRLALVAAEPREWGERAAGRLRSLAEGFADRGHEVAAFCTQFWGGYDERHCHGGVTYRAVTVAPARSSFTTRLPALLSEFAPDVIHARPTPSASVLAANASSTLTRAPLVVDWRGHERPSGRIARRAAAAPDAVVVPSGVVAARARELGTPDERLRRIPRPIDCDLIRSVDPDPTHDVVTAAPLSADGDLEGFLLALAELRRRDWSALVIGDGPRRETVADDLAALRIDDRVELAGDLSREERIAHYRGAHVFVDTRARSSFADELLWAMACGCVGIVEYREASAAHELLEGVPRGIRVTAPEAIEGAILDAADREHRTYDPEFERYDRPRIIGEYLETYRAAGE